MRQPRKMASSKQPGGTGAEAHGWESASRGAELPKSTGLFRDNGQRWPQGPEQDPSGEKTSKGQVTKSTLLRNGQKGRKSSRSLWHHRRKPETSLKEGAGQSFNCQEESVRRTVNALCLFLRFGVPHQTAPNSSLLTPGPKKGSQSRRTAGKSLSC